MILTFITINSRNKEHQTLNVISWIPHQTCQSKLKNLVYKLYFNFAIFIGFQVLEKLPVCDVASMTEMAPGCTRSKGAWVYCPIVLLWLQENTCSCSGIPDHSERTAPGKVDNAKECSMHLSKTSQVFSFFQIFGLPLQKKELAYC